MMLNHKQITLFFSTSRCRRTNPLCANDASNLPLLIVGWLAIPLALLSSGCRQGGQTGSTGLAPISQLPGQPVTTGPTMPSLGPFGASARVPPPPTGSYGNPNGLGASFNAMPANYAPSNLAPMSYNDTNQSNNIAVAGGVAATQYGHDPQIIDNGSTWRETSTSYPGMVNSQMDLSKDSTSSPRGSMPVNDLTHAPPPPGYSAGIGFNNMPGGFNTQSYPPQPGYPPQQQEYVPRANLPGQIQVTPLTPVPNMNSAPNYPTAPSDDAGGWSTLSPVPHPPLSNGPVTSQPISGGAMARSAPAANQPAFSTADRPIQWQTPRR
jgi:hypothetical protein